jgi:cell division transport system permease protein
VFLTYQVRLAAQSLSREKWINLLSVLTVAAGLLITAITLLSVYNIDLATKRLPEKFSLMLYLKDNLSQKEIDNILSAVKKDSSVEKVKYIPKEEALRELRKSLKNTEYILDDIGSNPLPDTIEIKLNSETIGPETVRQLTVNLKEIKGVNEIEYGEKFLSAIHSIRTGMKSIGIVFIIIMSTGMLFVCYSTVKILFYRRNEEIATYKLLGATKGFIRAPFIIEGAVIGFSGGILGLMGILSLYYLFFLKLSLLFPLFKTTIFPINMSFILPLLGLFLGITGAVLAIGRIRY